MVGLSIEETLSDSFVNDYHGNDWRLDSVARSNTIFVCNDNFKLFKLKIYNLLSHGVSDSISVNEDVVRHALVILLVSFERAVEIFLQNARANNLLTFLRLGTSLGIILAHVGIISSTEADDGLFALVADIYSYQHGLFRDLRSIVHSPKITA